MPKTIYLVRHGETNFNTDPEPRVRGRIEIPLNEEGLRHADQAGEFLKNEKIQAIYYSKLQRAKQTADAVHKHHESAKFVEEPLMIDISWGDWEGKTYKEAFGSADGGMFMKNPALLEIPNGESFYQVIDRIDKMMRKILTSTEDIVCLVSHGAIFNLLACYMFQSPLKNFWSFYMGGCAVSKIIIKDIDDFTVKYWNQTIHLK
ncbi:Histidine_phosphatase superfamily protein [Hexamita inflata]|uniref:Histidine_phosphatase superfamily protein n=1 Tax=Hexamita inflata TaxID=28002 RepID=A0ABP1HLS7_9EUKA